MDGVFVDGQRPATKKALREAAADDPARVQVECTSAFTARGTIALTRLPRGKYYVVGPDPYTSRKWYATIVVAADGRVGVV